MSLAQRTFGFCRWLAAAVAILTSWREADGRQTLPCRYQPVATIAAPPGPISHSPTIPTGMSPNGQYVVGYYNYDQVGPNRPWFWSEATGFVALPMPPGFLEAVPTDINNSQVMSVEGVLQSAGFRGYIYDRVNGSFTILPPLPGGTYSGAAAITEDGRVCGYRSIGPGVNPKTAFRWSPENGGTFEDLGTIDGHNTSGVKINELGEVSVSTGQVQAGRYAQLWTGNEVIDIGPIPNGISSDAGGLNNVGQMLIGGMIQQSPFVYRAFVFDVKSHEFTEVPHLPGAAGPAPRQIRDDGVIIGHCNFPTGPQRACIWLNLQPTDLSDMLPRDLNLAPRQARAISEDGRILCEVSPGGLIESLVIEPVWPSPGDTNCDEHVDVDDLIAVILDWGKCRDCAGDLTEDEVVNVDDLIEVLLNWGS